MTGLAIEYATEHIEVAVLEDSETRAHAVENVGHGHTRRLSPLVHEALNRAGQRPLDLGWIAADIGPGSFTGVRVGLATAEALALASGARRIGVSSLESLAFGAVAGTPSSRRVALVVPLVPAGRREVYAGFFRTTTPRRGGSDVRVLMAPQVTDAAGAIEGAREALAALRGTAVHFVGPGAGRERAALEAALPGSTSPEWRHDGLSALDLADTARRMITPEHANGGPPLRPLYVRPAQAEERVRRRALAAQGLVLRAFNHDDVTAVLEIERRVFADPWTDDFFHGELGQSLMHARIAEIEGQLAGYAMAWLGPGEGHLGNLAVSESYRRRGVARALVEDLLHHARLAGIERLSLEVRASNFAAQWLYRAYGFRLAGLRRGYYRDNGEDALILEWRADV